MKNVLFTIAPITLGVLLSTVYANEYISTSELLYDWDELVGKAVKFESQVGNVDLRDRTISIGDDFMTFVDASEADRDTLLWVSRNCGYIGNYNCWMLVEGLIKERGEFDFINNVKAQNIDFILPYAIAVSAKGWYSMSHHSSENALYSLQDLMEQESANHDCCLWALDWVSVHNISKHGVHLSAVVLEEWSNYQLFTASGPVSDANVLLNEAMSQCEEARANKGLLQRAASQCYEVFSEVVYE